MQKSFQKGKTAVVIGANSSIGKKLIPKLLLSYETLILTETSDDFYELENMITAICQEYPTYKIFPFELDIRKSGEVEKFRNFLEKDFRIDSLFYLAGINMLSPALEVTSEMWDHIMEVNLKGFFLISQCIAKNMILNQGGSIIAIASQHGVVVNSNRAVYCASKSGLIHLVKELAYEWAKYGIRVNTISPTMIVSEKNKEILDTPRAKKEYLSKIPLKKYATPEDICEAAVFLNSQKAGMITGENLIIDGGWTIC